jgi:putative pyruvate formate lyase activating enzyme
MSDYTACRLCPRDCGIDRNKIPGACKVTSSLKAARASLHFWEEPCISGKNGSGTVFFSGCNLGCVYCQNIEISRGNAGKEITPERLTEIYFELEEQGAENINLVTADHFLPTIAGTIEAAKKEGLKIPFLLNTSSYVKVDTLKRIEGLIDIYLPDFKYIRDEDAIRYSRAPGYTEAAKAAIGEMVRQQPKCLYKPENGLLSRGVVVRHLLLPGLLIQAKLILSYLYRTYGDRIIYSLLNQYTPNPELLSENYPEINRKVTEYEYHSLMEYAAELGIKNGYIQTGEAAGESFIPAFDLRGIQTK